MKEEKIKHAQTMLLETEVSALLSKSGEGNLKDALYRAVQHYLECDERKHPNNYYAYRFKKMK